MIYAKTGLVLKIFYEHDCGDFVSTSVFSHKIGVYKPYPLPNLLRYPKSLIIAQKEAKLVVSVETAEDVEFSTSWIAHNLEKTKLINFWDEGASNFKTSEDHVNGEYKGTISPVTRKDQGKYFLKFHSRDGFEQFAVYTTVISQDGEKELKSPIRKKKLYLKQIKY